MERDTAELKFEMKEFKNGMKEDRKRRDEEMNDFKNEMSDFKREMKEDRKKMNIQWGNLANKMGTLVEDVILPSLQTVIEEKFKIEIDEVMKRRLKRHPITKNIKEYDGIVVADDYVFLNSIKNTLKQRDIDEFINEIEDFRVFFPEYDNKKIRGIFASLNPDDNFIRFAEDNGFLVLGLGDWLMEWKNNEKFNPKDW